MWFKIRAVLTVLTNILMKGREAGLWQKKNTIIPLFTPEVKKKK